MWNLLPPLKKVKCMSEMSLHGSLRQVDSIMGFKLAVKEIRLKSLCPKTGQVPGKPVTGKNPKLQRVSEKLPWHEKLPHYVT